MIGKLLLKGMIAGIVAGVVAFAFAHHFGEPQVDRAIAFEESNAVHQHEQPALVSYQHAHNGNDEEETISRQTQSGVGLLTGIVLLGVTLGGGLSLVWAFCYQRIGPTNPRALSLCLALGGFLIFSLLPGIKYPPNPPAVGDQSTIGYRTALYFGTILLSAGILVVSIWCAHRLDARVGAWNAAGWAVLLAAGLLFSVYAVLPAVNEVSARFSADLLWRFRISSFGIHFVLWSVIGVMFGTLVESAPSLKRHGLSQEHR